MRLKDKVAIVTGSGRGNGEGWPSHDNAKHTRKGEVSIMWERECPIKALLY